MPSFELPGKAAIRECTVFAAARHDRRMIRRPTEA
jgi:hypothetical protein